MNPITKLFERKDRGLLSVYFTAGFPTLASTAEIIRELVAQRVDMIEVGVPFSDPMADGEVIQQSSAEALRNGMTLDLLLGQIAEVKDLSATTPLILMGYLNPMMQYGFERLLKRCKEVGISGLIIPDLPLAEYEREYRDLCRRYDIKMIMLITPETSDERIRKIDSVADEGFIYMVSSASTTGTKGSYSDSQLAYFKRVNEMGLRHRRLIGFGISNPVTFGNACDCSSGGIVGSLFIKCLDRHRGDIPAAVRELLSRLRGE